MDFSQSVHFDMHYTKGRDTKYFVLKYFTSSFMKLPLRKQLIPAWRSPGLARSALICYTPTGSEKYVRGRQEEEEEYSSLIRNEMYAL